MDQILYLIIYKLKNHIQIKEYEDIQNIWYLFCQFLHKNKITFPKDNNKEKIDEQEDFDFSKDENASFDIPPQRDLREVQPTISVNYRVIKNTNRDEYVESEEPIYKDDFKEDWNDMKDDKDWWNFLIKENNVK